MNSTLSKVQFEFAKNFLFPSTEWISQCLENVLSQSSFSFSASDLNKLCEIILLHFLHYDLVISSSSSQSYPSSNSTTPIKLPTSLDFSSNYQILQNEWCLVQIDGIYNISISKHKGKISSITSTEVNEEEEEEKMDVEQEEEGDRELNQSIRFTGNSAKDSNNRAYGNMNKLLLTDGTSRYIAYDLENVIMKSASKLQAATRGSEVTIGAGTKLLISRVTVRHGSLLLSSFTKILGGRNDYKELRKNTSDSSLFLDFDQTESLLSHQNTESYTNLSSFLSNFNQSSVSMSTAPFPESASSSSIVASRTIPPVSISPSALAPPPETPSTTSLYKIIKKSSDPLSGQESFTPLENDHPIYQDEFYHSTTTPYVNKVAPVSTSSNSKNQSNSAPSKSSHSGASSGIKGTPTISEIHNLNPLKPTYKDPVVIDISKGSSTSSSSSLSSPVPQSITSSSPSKLIPLSNRLFYFSDILADREKFTKTFFYIHAYPVKLFKTKIEFNASTNSYSYAMVLLYSDGETSQIIKLSNHLCTSYLGMSPDEYKKITQNDDTMVRKILRKFQSFTGIFKARLLTEEDREEEKSSSSSSSRSKEPTFLFLELSNNSILDICREVL